MLIQRLKTDFRLTLMTVFGTLTVAAIAPFAIYRFGRGQIAAGVADLVIQACIAAIVCYAWRGGNMDRAGLLVALFCSAGCVAVGQISGLPGVLWLYPVLLANFLLAARRPAVVTSAVGIAVLATNDALARLDAITFVVTALMVCLFAYIFSYRTEAQRRQLEGIAARDPLTGALNRRGMDRELQQAMDTALREGSPVGLAVLDLDGFKQVNDENGHEAGDAVLLRFAQLVRRLTRRDDRFFRLGGDEFALLLPGADADALQRVGQAVRRAMQRQDGEGSFAVTVSIGAATLRPGESARDWLHRADTAMYEAKRAGSDRVVIDRPAPCDG
jgi:diguanylate cyclase (GGDEF)-like protein